MHRASWMKLLGGNAARKTNASGQRAGLFGAQRDRRSLAYHPHEKTTARLSVVMGAVLAIAIVDLCFTLVSGGSTFFVEANPLARPIVGDRWRIMLFKLTLTALGGGALFAAKAFINRAGPRDPRSEPDGGVVDRAKSARRTLELACWFLLVANMFTVSRWMRYYHYLEIIAARQDCHLVNPPHAAVDECGSAILHSASTEGTDSCSAAHFDTPKAVGMRAAR